MAEVFDFNSRKKKQASKRLSSEIPASDRGRLIRFPEKKIARLPVERVTTMHTNDTTAAAAPASQALAREIDRFTEADDSILSPQAIHNLNTAAAEDRRWEDAESALGIIEFSLLDLADKPEQSLRLLLQDARDLREVHKDISKLQEALQMHTFVNRRAKRLEHIDQQINKFISACDAELRAVQPDATKNANTSSQHGWIYQIFHRSRPAGENRVPDIEYVQKCTALRESLVALSEKMNVALAKTKR